jgi:sensor c-di-GMP phosphodiesterase-like protein
MNLTVNPDVEVVIIIAFGLLIGVLVILGAIRMVRRSKSGVIA